MLHDSENIVSGISLAYFTEHSIRVRSSLYYHANIPAIMNNAATPPHQQSMLCNLTPIRPLLIQPRSNDSPDSILQNIPQRKRRRGRRSCNACRQRRMKCDADTILPCSGCKHFGVECHFRNEKGPTNLIQVFEDRVTRLEGLLNRTLDQRQTNQTRTLVKKSRTPDFFQGDNFPYQSLVCGYKGLVPPNATLELVEQMNLLQLSDYGTTRYIGSSSGVQLLSPFKISERYRVKDDHSTILQQVNNSDDEVVFVKAKGVQRSPVLPCITQSTTILNDIPGLTEELIDLVIHAYFAFIQPNLPIINKLSFLQQYYYQNPDPPDEYLLSAMCAIGIDFLKFQDGLVVGTDINRDTVRSIRRCLGDKAAKVLQVAHRRSQISTVQTLILLTSFLTVSYEGDDEEDSIHWITAGIAVNMAQDLGLHRSSAEWNIPECETELRRRIWYAIYTIDVWMAAELGRPTAISDNAFDVEFPSVYEIDSIYHTISDNEDISVCHPVLISQAELSLRRKSPDYGFFLHLALLSQILRRVLCLLYPQRSADVAQNNVEIIEGLDAALRAWKSNLPVHLQISSIIHDDIAVGDRALLHVFYSCVTVVLHRPLIEDRDLFGTVSWIQSQCVCTTAALDIMYTMDALASSMSDHIPRSVVGYSVFQAARVFAFNASSENEYERDLGRLNVAHCAETYIVEEAYIRNSRIVYQLMNLLEGLHLHKEVTRLSDDVTKSNRPTELANQHRSKILTNHLGTRKPEQSLYGNSFSCGPTDPYIKETQHINHHLNTPFTDSWEQLSSSNGSQHITLTEQLLNTNSFSNMDSMRQFMLPLSLDQHNLNSKIPVSIATQTSNSGKAAVDKDLKSQPEGQQNLKSTEEIEFSMALWGLYDTF